MMIDRRGPASGCFWLSPFAQQYQFPTKVQWKIEEIRTTDRAGNAVVEGLSILRIYESGEKQSS
jgi:hypothetical protein